MKKTDLAKALKLFKGTAVAMCGFGESKPYNEDEWEAWVGYSQPMNIGMTMTTGEHDKQRWLVVAMWCYGKKDSRFEEVFGLN